MLFDLALLSLLTVHGLRGGDDPPRVDMRDFVNRLFTAWLALGETLGLN
jgi:hypothetical protein